MVGSACYNFAAHTNVLEVLVTMCHQAVPVLEAVPPLPPPPAPQGGEVRDLL